MIQPPSSGPITGATSVVMAHIAIASPAAPRVARQQQRLRQRDHRPGDEALQHAKHDQRVMLGASPHSQDAITNSTTLPTNRRT